ncbi:hypothetical protein [Burkholderia aenigmatica]|uniref:hypothetical protein n=1 Tax=Burkholderia aenigmatica TaxID=2015348 RepID=UPI002656D259|nr:hypothetical protein [Burkholderia aenigmatica]MDN7873820.1 hypothetical protein [Burkholderia aenigmatica]
MTRVDQDGRCEAGVKRQMLFALLNIDFDCCHSGRVGAIFNGDTILAFDGDTF